VERRALTFGRLPIPVVYTDFLSMYPTVNSLMGLWRFVVANQVRVIPQKQHEVRKLLSSITLSNLFIPSTWTRFPYFVRVIPNRDVLPSRSNYSIASKDWQVALNYLSAKTKSHKDALWYALPDIIASRLITGRTPTIVDAFSATRRGAFSMSGRKTSCVASCREALNTSFPVNLRLRAPA
jgi:hypothetical protein